MIEFTAAEVAAEITRRLRIPTICIGAGPECDGQILVLHDMVGLSEIEPFFAKKYINLREQILRAVSEYVQDVKQRRFPGPEHYRKMRREEYERFLKMLESRDEAQREGMHSRC